MFIQRSHLPSALLSALGGHSRTVAFIALLLMVVGCGKKERGDRVYQEIHITSTKKEAAIPGDKEPIADKPPPTKGAGVAWTPPEGWTVRQPTTMRAGSFEIDGADISIIPAGESVENNIKRWIGQIADGADRPTSKELADAMKAVQRLTTEGDYTCHVTDLSDFAGEGDDAKSILGGIIPRQGQFSIFIKMTGPKSVITAHKDAFIGLCKSIR